MAIDPKRVLADVGTAVQTDFVEKRSILSFEEYLALVVQSPRQQLRNAAQYLKECIDAFGATEVAHPSGVMRRFRIFDGSPDDPTGRVAGQEEVQNALYRVLGNFVRAGEVSRLILLHGPNGSAKSSLVDCLKRGLESYSHRPDGALYTFNFIFPSEKLVKGNIGFGETVRGGPSGSYAYLEAEQIEVRIRTPLRESPLLLLPKEQRVALFKQLVGEGEVLPTVLLQGELSHKMRRVYDALMVAYAGDLNKVLRHVQVERFYVSRRYQAACVTVEPSLSVDAADQQVTADRTQGNLPPMLQSVVLYEPHGPLVNANRGIIEYADLLKRPLEAYKYLLGFCESGEVPVEHQVLQLDEVLIASSNEKHLAAFKELPDFASFKGRIELVRVPYLRRWPVEKEIYDAQVNARSVGRHVAPHATAVAALWATLTRLKKPMTDRYSTDVKILIERLTPIEKMTLYATLEAPAQLTQQQQKALKKAVSMLYEESESYPNYEGRGGASAREVKTALFNAAQSADHDSLHPLAVLKELRALTKDKTVYEFLQQEVVEGFHDHAEFVSVVEGWYLDQVDHEVRASMGLVSDQQYKEQFERYVQQVSAWVKGEKVPNKLTGQPEKPDEGRMGEFEGIVMPKSDDPKEFRKSLIASVGAWRIDNPDAPVDYGRIFPDLMKRLVDHFFDERKRTLKRNVENTLKYLSDERASLSAKDQQQVRGMLDEMIRRFGYAEGSAKDAIVALVRARYS